MSPFEFVAVFFSVIVGLALSHMLTAASDLIEIRARVRTDWIHTTWALVVTAMTVHSWWGMWDLKDLPSWNYASFLLIVAVLATTYLLCTLVFPRAPDNESIVDLGEHFRTVRPFFLSMFAANNVIAVAANIFLFKTPLVSQFTGLPIGLIILLLVGVRVNNRKYHAFLAILFLLFAAVVLVTDTTVLSG